MGSVRKDKLYRTISEVSNLVGVEPHVLRYWESEFKLLKPKRTRSGNRAYRPEDIETIKEIKRLLYVEKYTLEGAKKKLLAKKKRQKHKPEDKSELGSLLAEIKKEIEEILSLLGD